MTGRGHQGQGCACAFQKLPATFHHQHALSLFAFLQALKAIIKQNARGGNHNLTTAFSK